MDKQCNKLMVYGILKKGFALDLTKRGCKFLGECSLPYANLYGLGYKDATGTWTGVGLRFVEDPTRVAYGELFEIPREIELGKGIFHPWRWLDEIEQNGFCYTRKIVQVIQEVKDPPIQGEFGAHNADAICITMSNAWVYEHTYPGTKYTDANLIENGRF